MNNREIILEVKELEVLFGKGKNRIKAVDNVNFQIYKGETFGLVGESGSGKTTIGRSIIRLNQIKRGEIKFNGQLISGKLSRNQHRELTRNIQMIFQDPISSLNERAKVDYIVSEGLYNLDTNLDSSQIREKVANTLLDVGLLPEHGSRFPHEFSGGQRQRIGMARALIMEPKFIIADEPISALDVSIRAQIMNLLLELQEQKGLTYLFIAHDLSIVRYICDRVAILYRGKIVELGETENLFRNPLHPYTRALLSAIPVPDPIFEKNKKLKAYRSKLYNGEESWTEIEPGHFVLGTKEEILGYKKDIRYNSI